jgi:hypothetical protein
MVARALAWSRSTTASKISTCWSANAAGEVSFSWWPIAAMLVVYSLITLVSAALAPEVRGRDLVRLEDAA